MASAFSMVVEYILRVASASIPAAASPAWRRRTSQQKAVGGVGQRAQFNLATSRNRTVRPSAAGLDKDVPNWWISFSRR